MVTPTQGTLLLLLGTLALGGTSLLIATVDADPLSLAALRCLLAVPLLLPLVLWELRRVNRFEALPRRTLVGAAAAGLALGVDYSFWNSSIQLVGPGIATVLLNIQLVLLPLIAWIVDRIRPMKQLRVIIPVMVAGIVLTANAVQALHSGQLQLRGVLYGLAAGTGYAIYLSVIRRTAPAKTKPAPFSVLTVVCLFAGIAAALAALVSSRWTWPATGDDWTSVLILALVGQVLVFWCLNVGMTGISETAMSTLLLLPGVFATVSASLFLSHLPSLSQLAGCALIIAGAWWASAASHRHSRLASSESPESRH